MTTEPPDYYQGGASTEAIHNRPPTAGGVPVLPKTPHQLWQIGTELIEQFLKRVVNAVVGVFIPGVDAFQQLQDWADDLGDMVADIPIFGPWIEWLLALFGVDIGEPGGPSGLPTPQDMWGNVVNAFIKPLNAFAQLVGGLISGAVIPILDPTKILNLPGLFNDVTRGFKNFFEAWFGVPSSATTPEEAADEVVTTVASIKSAVLDGYTVTIFSASDHAWVIPAGTTQITGVVIGGGGRGGNGQGGGGGLREGGLGGSSGGYLAAELDISGLTPGSSTLDITVGAAASTAGASGGVSSIVASTGTLLASAPNASGISTKDGLLSTTSMPGKGGKGGDANSSGPTANDGLAGEDTGLASGGAGGNGIVNPGVGGSGQSGAAGSSTDVPLCGGSGGGGGGARATNVALTGVIGGSGGHGGFPGGGSGGGGGASNSGIPSTADGGNAGIPGNGLVALIHK